MLTPAFHFEILDDYLHVMNEQADILVEKLTKLIAKGKPIDMFKILQLCTLDVMSGKMRFRKTLHFSRFCNQNLSNRNCHGSKCECSK